MASAGSGRLCGAFATLVAGGGEAVVPCMDGAARKRSSAVSGKSRSGGRMGKRNSWSTDTGGGGACDDGLAATGAMPELVDLKALAMGCGVAGGSPDTGK